MARMDVRIEVEHDGTLEAARELGAILGRIDTMTLPAFLRERLERCRGGDLVEVAGQVPCDDPGVIKFRVVPSATMLTLLADLRVRVAL